METGDRSAAGKKRSAFWYTTVAILCALAIVIAGIIILRDGSDAEGAPFSVNRTEETKEDQSLSVGQSMPTVDSTENPNGGRSGDGASGADGALDGTFVRPVKNGQIAKAFSDEELQYSVTLDQYELHKGIDFAAPENTPVKACADGTVVKVEKDDKYGLTIELDHGNGYVTRYCNLSTEGLVETGDVVQAGAEISGVGRAALFESQDPPHLHFEVRKDGVPVDPLPLLCSE